MIHKAAETCLRFLCVIFLLSFFSADIINLVYDKHFLAASTSCSISMLFYAYDEVMYGNE